MLNSNKQINNQTNQLQCIVFCDDVGMPSKDTYGSQPPLELLRQWLDHGYWSDLVDMTKIELADMVSCNNFVIRIYLRRLFSWWKSRKL